MGDYLAQVGPHPFRIQSPQAVVTAESDDDVFGIQGAYDLLANEPPTGRVAAHALVAHDKLQSQLIELSLQVVGVALPQGDPVPRGQTIAERDDNRMGA